MSNEKIVQEQNELAILETQLDADDLDVVIGGLKVIDECESTYKVCGSTYASNGTP